MKSTFHCIRLRIAMLLATGTLLIMVSCRQKDLIYVLEPMKVNVEFNWSGAEKALPDGMTLLFFPIDGNSKPWRFDIEGRDGGPIEIFPGDYRILAYNNDLPGVEFIATDSYDRFSATVHYISDSLAMSTGMLYAAHLHEVCISKRHGYIQQVVLFPDSMSTVYHIKLDSVSGSERIKTASAVLKGLARSVCLQLGCNSKDTCCVSTPLHIMTNLNSVLETTATGFGNPQITNPRIFLEIIVTTSHGKYSKTVDVTDQVMNSLNPRNVDIHISGLDIPAADTPENPGSGPDVGISVGVDGWNVIEINYS